MNPELSKRDFQERLKLLVVDDEKDACTLVRDILNRHTELPVAICGTAHNTNEAAMLVAALDPDALLLDIEMPRENAFQFLRRLGKLRFDVIFITAYNEFAVKAFQLNAVDYLLKPLLEEDLVRAVKRLLERRAYSHSHEHRQAQLGSVYEQLERNTAARRIFLKSKNTMEIVAIEDVLYVEAMSSYSKVVFRKGKVIAESVTSYPLSTYVNLLPEVIFYRIHKSYLINCNSIAEIRSGEQTAVVLTEGTVLPVGKRRQASFIAFLKKDNFLKGNY